MKNFIKIGVLFLLVFAASCSDDTTNAPSVERELKTFTANIDNSNFGGVNLRVINSQWEVGDEIGIFMFKSSSELSDTSILGTGNNSPYKASNTTGVFNPSGKGLTFPNDQDQIDFIAYYPYKDGISNFNYPIDISNQDEQLDVLYSNNLKGTTLQASKNLLFNHVMTKIEVNLTSSDNVDFSTILLKLKGQNVKGSLSLTNGAILVGNDKADINLKKVSDTKREVLLFPSSDVVATLILTVNGVDKEVELSKLNLSAGKNNKFTLNLKGDNIDPKPQVNEWVETPSFAKVDNQEYISYFLSSSSRNFENKRNYSMLYDTKNRVALWVAYPLHSSYRGDVSRTKTWSYAPDVQESYQPDVVKNTWPSFTSLNYNRGHQIASGDRTATVEMNNMTFYTTNATLQKENLNGGVWNKLETALQNYVTTNVNDTVYIVTGVMLSTTEKPTISYEKDNSDRDCAIPQYFYKAIYVKNNGSDVTYAYKMPNENLSMSEQYNTYVTSVSQLEKETGFTFFNKVSTSVKDKIANF